MYVCICDLSVSLSQSPPPLPSEARVYNTRTLLHLVGCGERSHRGGGAAHSRWEQEEGRSAKGAWRRSQRHTKNLPRTASAENDEEEQKSEWMMCSQYGMRISAQCLSLSLSLCVCVFGMSARLCISSMCICYLLCNDSNFRNGRGKRRRRRKSSRISSSRKHCLPPALCHALISISVYSFDLCRENRRDCRSIMLCLNSEIWLKSIILHTLSNKCISFPTVYEVHVHKSIILISVSRNTGINTF